MKGTSEYQGSLTRLALFMCSSFLLIFGVNLSSVLFLPVLARLATSGALFRLDRFRLWALLFVCGATLSTASNLWRGDPELFANSLAVYPNYLYWSTIIWAMAALGTTARIDQYRLFGAIGGGVVAVSLYYVFLQDRIGDNVFFKRFTPNDLSFLLICFTPYLVYWVRRRSAVASLVVLGTIVAGQALAGRRAGFVLVMLGGSLAYWSSLLRFDKHSAVLRLAVIACVSGFVLQSGPVRELMHERSERVAEFVYGGSTALDEDRSYLVRRAMQEKAVNLFLDYKAVGVGLNNFAKVEGRIDGDFEGAEFVTSKRIRSLTSSHNSYLNVLAEGGLALFIPFVGILLTAFASCLRNFGRMDDCGKVILISFFVMAVHLAFINAIVTSAAWFNLGLTIYLAAHLRSARAWTAAVERSRTTGLIATSPARSARLGLRPHVR